MIEISNASSTHEATRALLHRLGDALLTAVANHDDAAVIEVKNVLTAFADDLAAAVAAIDAPAVRLTTVSSAVSSEVAPA